jgi:DNA-binding beta-propeller fold protein YncE
MTVAESGSRGAGSPVTVGRGAFRFEVDEGWGRLPEGWSFVEVTAVATDSRDRAYVFNRGEHPVAIFDRDGTFVSSWGEGLFARPHGLFIAPDDSVYCTDDAGQTVRKFTPDGTLLLTLGTSGVSSDTGAQGSDYRTIRRAGPPFNYPTNLALAPDGALYVTDGYANARVHKFSADGRLLFSWGEPGDGPGQFHVPHGVAIDGQGTVYVADRENSRLQLFDPGGKFLAEWTDVARPSQVVIDDSGNVLVAELGFRAGLWPGTSPPGPDVTGGRVSVFDRDGALLARWGGGTNPCAPGDFFAPHDLWLDSRGDLYVAEVTWSAGGNRGLVASDCHTIQKFVRRAEPPDGSRGRR